MAEVCPRADGRLTVCLVGRHPHTGLKGVESIFEASELINVSEIPQYFQKAHTASTLLNTGFSGHPTFSAPHQKAPNSDHFPRVRSNDEPRKRPSRPIMESNLQLGKFQATKLPWRRGKEVETNA
ncbi:hypothetical protein HYALB_00004515 [Hymenoscyphus albidus]|uniref:Uncharacterized protein n=1 Tax=Hymenoscyphus albidus TaxID=595503 RepID=A0A9N9M3C5_9HELO|nr:hypothetical protein HYALB_00004515 [Hymenoscyphus albidus]